MKGRDTMNMIQSSVFYRMCKYIINIHEHSLFYKSRKKENSYPSYEPKTPLYRQARVYRVCCAIGKCFGYMFKAIHDGAKSSGMIGVFGSAMKTMKRTKLWAFNQLLVSIIAGYIVTNLVLGTFAAYKVKYLVAFVGIMIGTNIGVYLWLRFKDSSLIGKLWKSLTH